MPYSISTKVRKTYQPTEQDLRAYYDSHQGDFKANRSDATGRLYLHLDRRRGKDRPGLR
jgi:hypothetical protein